MRNIFKFGIQDIFRLTIFLLIECSIFFVFTKVFGGMTLPDFYSAFLLILALSIINALLWPLLGYISLKFLVFTLGFGTFIIDGVMLWVISEFIPGVSIDGISLFTIPLLIALINTALSMILGIDGSSYYRSILKSEIEPSDEEVNKREGFVFLEIDGLAYEVLRDAIKQGLMPNVKSMIDDGTHKLVSWETDLSSQTSSSQAGILHGNNANIPAFRWVEKENDNKIVSSNAMSDANKIEKEISNGKGLLSCHGASRGNLFSGDAADYMLTYSKFGKLSDFYTKTWYYLYVSPFVMARILLLFIMDIFSEVYSRIYHKVKDIRPRLNRGLTYFVARAGANVVMREATTLALIGDIYAGGYNVLYSTYMGYDEIAHHSGIRDRDSFKALKQVDYQVGRLLEVMADAKRRYNLVILSDHGQSQGSTFKQKYGITLNNLIKGYLPEEVNIHSILHSNDDHFTEKFSLNTQEGDYSTNKEEVQSIILASGNLGLIYFTDWTKRVTYEEIMEAFPNLLENLTKHEGIGFVMVNSEEMGPVALSGDNMCILEKKEFVGDDFLSIYGDNVIEHLLRTNDFEHVPDILVNSTYDVKTKEVYAFEELIGSHGGVGGTQQEPFILCPSSWTVDENIVGAENVNKFFKREIRRSWNK